MRVCVCVYVYVHMCEFVYECVAGNIRTYKGTLRGKRRHLDMRQSYVQTAISLGKRGNREERIGERKQGRGDKVKRIREGSQGKEYSQPTASKTEPK